MKHHVSILALLVMLGGLSWAETNDLGTFDKKVTFTIAYNGAESLSGIPVLVKLAANSPVGFDYADCAADGSDLRFADQDGQPLPFEIDTWNPAGESLVWVKPGAVTQGTTFNLYYNGTPTVQNDPTAVWSAYTGVWHFGALAADTTAHSQGLYPNATATAGLDAHLSPDSIPGEAGSLGKAFRVNDSTGPSQGNFNLGGAWVVDSGDDSPLDAKGVFTFSVLVKHNNWNYNNDKLVYKRLNSNNTGEPNNGFVFEVQSSNTKSGKMAVKSSSDSRNRDDNLVGPNPIDGWVYVTGVYDGKSVSLYENGGAFVKAAPYLGAVTDNNSPLVFGNTVTIVNGEAGGNAWNGWIDEARFLRTAQSADWLAAEYAAMTSETFLFAGRVENVGEGAAQPPLLGEVTVTPDISSAIFAGEILAVGSDATACDVTLAVGSSLDALGEPITIAEGVTESFEYELTGLEDRTTYFYQLTLANNATDSLRAVKSGSFKTKVDPSKGYVPAATAQETRVMIQEALDEAAGDPEIDSVILGVGLFEVDAELTVSGGVTLRGQGADDTILKYVGTKNTGTSRPVTISEGATLSHLAVTGASVGQNQYVGGGVMVSGTQGATISWCTITNNVNAVGSGGGIGIYATGPVVIDHCIIANNTAGTHIDRTGGGIGTRPGATGLSLTVDASLIYGNTVANTSCGAGIGIVNKVVTETGDSAHITAFIRNTTIIDNAVTGTKTGGGLFTTQKNVTLINCIFANNTAPEGDPNYAFNNETIAAAVKEKASNNLFFETGTTVFGANPISRDPCFKDAAHHDYHLGGNSPAVAAGLVYAGLGTDLDDVPFGAKPSIGCYQKDRSGLLIILR